MPMVVIHLEASVVIAEAELADQYRNANLPVQLLRSLRNKRPDLSGRPPCKGVTFLVGGYEVLFCCAST